MSRLSRSRMQTEPQMTLVLHASNYPARQGISVAKTPPFTPPSTPGSPEPVPQMIPLGRADLPAKPLEML
ncbi:uncharacterized protein N7529_005688 [Penicillium soppii]|uniref:uncharacterized protein n=1 Tax=Penicillium soppii TaxID=69789 RepID=UPI0025466FE7|nr:uncharacterized protein N7529_005688 [Penicillium soppii]KAJ5863772.1 hypothetical protein N7529_005688 [Penicillium soppii]